MTGWSTKELSSGVVGKCISGKDKGLVIWLEYSDLYNGDFRAACWENNIHCIPFLAYGNDICNTFQRMIFPLLTEEFDDNFFRSQNDSSRDDKMKVTVIVAVEQSKCSVKKIYWMHEKQLV